MGYLIKFFLKNNLYSKRFLWMTILSFIPVGFGMILWLLRPVLSKEGIALSGLYPQMGFFLYLHFLLPLMAVFMGAAVIADEVEERTLPYLLIRPIPRYRIVITKTIANMISLGGLLVISLFLTYSLMAIDKGIGNWGKHISIFLQSGAVLLLGTLVYIPFFACFGGMIKRPVLVGLFFSFGWENTVGFFPGNVKLFTIVHYLHVLFPPLQKYRFLNLIIPTKQISGEMAGFILFILTAVFIGVSVSLLYIREYRLDQG